LIPEKNGRAFLGAMIKLNDNNSGKGPTASALTLVFYRRHASVFTPIDLNIINILIIKY
jgi:hypothetical protein